MIKHHSCIFWQGRLCRVLLVLALLPWIGVRRVCAQDSPRELRQQAYAKLARGDFIDAIPDLEQLIEYFGKSKKSQIKATMEMVYYNLALCHFFIGQFDKAEDAFKLYLKKYRSGAKRSMAELFIADTLRFRGKLDRAIKAYREALKKYEYAYSNQVKTDIYSAIARCYLAQDNWHAAIEPLINTYRVAVDFVYQNWAATLLTTAYFKDLDLGKVYPLVPHLLRPNSFASRSVAFNLAALEAGDLLFADERYRDALWVHRMVYPHDMVTLRSQEYLEYLQRLAERTKISLADPRRLMRIQESIGEIEEELKALEGIENYDMELYSRIARGYMEMQRYWEGREIFLYLYETADSELAEESLYLAFRCSCQIPPWNRAFEIGEQYMEEYPAGEFFDALTLAMGQLYAKLQDWPSVIRHLTKSLEISPNHESAAECMFLIGYASFMEEKFEDAVSWMGKIISRFPESELVPSATYWTGMALLFDAKYEEALAEFDRVLEEFPDCEYVEDSAFRTAVCEYGLSRFERSDTRLKVFLASYPDSKLAGEALMMRGDIGGAVGRPAEAVQYYRDAMSHETLNIEFYNHCAFQCGNILFDDEDHLRLREHFRKYIDVNRKGSNIPQAIYWVGVALWNSGEQEGSLRYYREAVEKFGNEPHQIGIDMILDEWVGRARRATTVEADQAWTELQQSLVKAIRAGNATMALRLKRAVLFDPGIKQETRKRTIDGMLQEKYFPYASPAVLQTMLDHAGKSGNSDFAVKVAKHIVETFTETDYALDARMVLAQHAIEETRRTNDKLKAEEFFKEAIKHLGVIREVFATSSEAGKALIILGQLYLEQRKYKEADEIYESVLGVRGWRNFWPEALYGRGECRFARRHYDEASAYYERIYLLYSHHTAWTAKGYLRRAECLKRMYESEKAREVLREMLQNGELAGLPEVEAARALLKKLEGAS